MKTFNDYFRKMLIIALVAISTMTLYAQKNSKSESLIVHLDPVSVDGNYASFKKMVSNIVPRNDFKYRKALRRAKAAQAHYVFSGKEISEVEILKHFKKAARKAENVADFKSYFHDRQLSFIEVLNEKTVYNLYASFRATTFKGYLEELDAFFG